MAKRPCGVVRTGMQGMGGEGQKVGNLQVRNLAVFILFGGS